MFTKVQTSVIKVLDTKLLALPRENLLDLFSMHWPSLEASFKGDICLKVGINPINIDKNIDIFDKLASDRNNESIKDSKLQKLTYLSKMYSKLEKYK